VLVRVLVHDGFSTATSEPISVEVPERGPEVAILHPEEGSVFAAGGTLRVWASVTDQAGTPLANAWCRWVLDGREAAQGPDAWLEAPDPGEHKLTLIVQSGTRQVEQSVSFVCRAGPAEYASSPA
jgi:hypothetical protein